MDKKSKWVVLIFILVILVSIFFTYKRSFLDRNFIILEGEEMAEKEPGELEPGDETTDASLKSS